MLLCLQFAKGIAMASCLFFMPILTSQVHHRTAKIYEAIRSLRASLVYAMPILRQWKFHIHINGNADYEEEFKLLTGLLDLVKIPTVITASKYTGKINAVNYGISQARKENKMFFCVDNDISIPLHATRNMLELFSSANNRDGVTCHKAPLLTENSTDFQRVYSYSVQMSFLYNIYPKRPTGSFYCIDPNRVTRFPENCNEGDYLDRLNILRSWEVVLSEYPATISEEIERRKRLRKSSDAIGYSRIHSESDFLEKGFQKNTPSFLVRDDLYIKSIAQHKFVRDSISVECPSDENGRSKNAQ